MPRTKTKPPLRRELVHVVWFDASMQSGQLEEQELETECLVETAGILVKESRGSISIALDRIEGCDGWREVMHIPKANVLKIQRFKLTVPEVHAPK